MAGTKITLFLPTDDPQGLKMAWMGNWNGMALAAPRSALRDLFSREELSKPGIYCLTGRDAKTDRPTAYIGEAETLNSRLRMHQDREFWVQASVVVSRDDSLSKSHTRYLEGRLIADARHAGRWDLVNSASSGAKLSEADRAEMEGFYSRVTQLLPLIGCDLLGPRRDHVATKPLICRIKGLRAYGHRTPEGFVVLRNSEGSLEVRPSAQIHSPWMAPLRERMIATGAVKKGPDRLVFLRDVIFPSPSRAAAVIRGGNANGQTEWQDENGVTLRELETL